MSTITKVAFLGMGVMGGPMAANLAKAGFDVAVWNRTPNRPGTETAVAAGASVSHSIAEAVKGREAILTCLGDVPDVQEVVLGKGGMAEFAERGTLVIDFSTIGPKASKRIGTELHGRGLRFLDAPVSGGDIGAIGGTLTIMVGGERDDFDEASGIFSAMGKTIRHCGPSGSGQAVKLCNQVLGAVHMVAVCEAFSLAKSLGVDPLLVTEICSTGAAGSWALENLGPRVVAEDYAPGFMIKHMRKDLRLASELAEAAGLSMEAFEYASRLFDKVAAKDGGAGDLQGTQAMNRAFE